MIVPKYYQDIIDILFQVFICKTEVNMGPHNVMKLIWAPHNVMKLIWAPHNVMKLIWAPHQLKLYNVQTSSSVKAETYNTHICFWLKLYIIQSSSSVQVI